MTIRKLHESLTAIVAQAVPNTHPKIGANEILAKNAFSPFNMLAISKTKLEKVGSSDELGEISLFSYGKNPLATLYLYSSKLKMYGGAGNLDGKENIVSMIETGNISSVTEKLKDGMQHQDEVDVYISKDITKMLKSISSKHGLNDDVSFEFTKDGIKAYILKDSSIINIRYTATIDAKLIGHGFTQSGIKSLKSGVWKLIGDKVYDHTGEGIFLNSSRNSRMDSISMPSDHITLKGSTISKMAKFAGQIVDKNNPKVALNYLLIDVKDGQGKFIGTDMRRLSISNEFKVGGKDGKYHIHAMHLQDNPTSIKLSEHIIEIEYKDHTYTQKLDYDPKYPDYQRIVPKYMKSAFEIKSSEFKKLKGEVFIIVKDNKVFWAKADKDYADLTKDDMNQFKIEDINSSDIFFALDSKYIKDAIDGSEIVTVNMNERNLPIRIDGEHGITVVMPIVANTKEEIEEAELKRQNKSYEAEIREAKRKEEQVEREKEELERLKKEDGVAHEWLNTLSPMGRGKARITMSKQISRNGKILTKSEYIKAYADEGREFKQKTYTPHGSSRERTEWGAFDGGTWATITATEAKFGLYLQSNGR